MSCIQRHIVIAGAGLSTQVFLILGSVLILLHHTAFLSCMVFRKEVMPWGRRLSSCQAPHRYLNTTNFFQQRGSMVWGTLPVWTLVSVNKVLANGFVIYLSWQVTLGSHHFFNDQFSYIWNRVMIHLLRGLYEIKLVSSMPTKLLLVLVTLYYYSLPEALIVSCSSLVAQW